MSSPARASSPSGPSAGSLPATSIGAHGGRRCAEEGARVFAAGLNFGQRGDVLEAEKAYRLADRLGHAGAAVNLGLLLKAREDVEGAEQAFRRADERGDARGAFHLAWLLQERGDLVGAEAGYWRAKLRGYPAAEANLFRPRERPKEGARDLGDDAGAHAFASETVPTTPEPREHDEGTLMARLTSGTARMASATGLRQVLTTGLLVITASTVARCLGPLNFGEYAGGTAAFNLTNSLIDLGFSLVLVREMTHRVEDRGRLMGAAIQSQFLWSLVLTAFLVVSGITAGGTRGAVMLALSPAVALSGLGVSRQIFNVRFHATPLLILDVSTNVVQCLVMIGLALAHAPVIALALNMSFFSCLTGAVALLMARKVVRIKLAERHEVWRFLRTAMPLGFASVLASLYFTIDQTLLGWLVTPKALSQYAIAVRLLTLVVTIPGFVMTAAVPGLARTSSDRAQLSRFAATVSHWIAVTALPLGIGVAVFARPAVLLLFGPAYLGAVPLVRILMLAALLSFASNVLGITLMTLSIVRPQIVFNSISLAINVAGNLILAPRYGVIASAWLTVACEGIAVSYGLVTLRRRLSYRALIVQLWRPCAVAGGAGLVGVLLGGRDVVAIVAVVFLFLAAMTVFRAWPDILSAQVRRRLGRGVAADGTA